MKKILLILISFIFCVKLHAQWTPLNSGTTVNLNDVDFLNPGYGIAGGDSGMVLLTTNAGYNWTPLFIGSGNVEAVHIIAQDSFLVSLVDGNNIPHSYMTYNSGIFWIPLFQDSLCFRAADSDNGTNGRWVSVSSNVIGSNDGLNWDTLMQFTCGTNNITRIQAIDSTFNAGGLISGIVTYSASMIRSEDGGKHFYGFDPFMFQTADALTAFDFPFPDTGYIFMNKYSGFTPGNSNSVRKIFDFVLTPAASGDSEFVFNSSVLDTTLPAYINDGKFFTTGQGFAAGEDGNIYESLAAGTGWVSTYNNNTISLNRLSFPDEHYGYAVGDHGTILKWNIPTSIARIEKKSLRIYPNPTTSTLNIAGIATGKFMIQDINGRIISSGIISNNLIPLANILNGIYFITIESENEIFRNKFIKQ